MGKSEEWKQIIAVIKREKRTKVTHGSLKRYEETLEHFYR